MDTTTFEYPSVWRRFMAIIYECILLVGPAFLMAFFFLFFFTESDQTLSYSSQNTFALRLLLFIMFSIYFTWSWSYHRCTLPMKTLNLKIVDLQGNDISLSKAFIRFLVAIPKHKCDVYFFHSCPRWAFDIKNMVLRTSTSTHKYKIQLSGYKINDERELKLFVYVNKIFTRIFILHQRYFVCLI